MLPSAAVVIPPSAGRFRGSETGVTAPAGVTRARREPAAIHIAPSWPAVMPWLMPPTLSAPITRLVVAFNALVRLGRGTTLPVEEPDRGITDTSPCDVTRTAIVPAATH